MTSLQDTTLFIAITSNGYCIEMQEEKIPLAQVGGKPINIFSVTEETGEVVSILGMNPFEQEILLVTKKGKVIRLNYIDNVIDEMFRIGSNSLKIAEIEGDDQIADAVTIRTL